MPVRLAHFSDVHLTSRRLGWTVRDVFGKRTTGWVNVNLLDGRSIPACPVRGRCASPRPGHVEARSPDLLGRCDHARLRYRDGRCRDGAGSRRCRPSAGHCGARKPRRIRVPDGAACAFEAAFASWQEGQRVGSAIYPFARKVGHVWLIGLNSAKSNFGCGTRPGRWARSNSALPRTLRGPRRGSAHCRQPLPDPHQEADSRTRFHRLRDWDASARRPWNAASISGCMAIATVVCVAGRTEPTLRNHLCRQFDADKEVGYHEYTIEDRKLTGRGAFRAPRPVCSRIMKSFELELPAPPQSRW